MLNGSQLPCENEQWGKILKYLRACERYLRHFLNFSVTIVFANKILVFFTY